MRIDEGGPNLWITSQSTEYIRDCLSEQPAFSLGTVGGWIVHRSRPSLRKMSCSQCIPSLSPEDLYKCIEVSGHLGVQGAEFCDLPAGVENRRVIPSTEGITDVRQTQ